MHMFKAERNLMSQSHSHASLAEHIEMWLELERHQNPLTSEIIKFFELADVSLTMKELQFPALELPNIHRCAKRCFKWHLVFEGGDKYGTVLWAPCYTRVEVRPGKRGSFLLEGSQFFQLQNGSKRVWLFGQSFKSGICEVKLTMIAPRKEKRQLHREAATLTRCMNRHHYLHGQALRTDATLISRQDQVHWHDVALEPGVVAALKDNIIGMLSQRALFQRNGIPQKRGILLYGPPGTGKTMVGKVLAGIHAATFIWVTAADNSSVDSVRTIFKLARRLKPTIVFLEDLDLYASERTRGSSTTLGELLSQMDGLEQNDGLIVVATTNDLAAIEPALRDRPSRFDVVLELGLPKTMARRSILAKHLARQLPSDEVLDRAATDTAGLSGAQVREVAVLAIQQAILRGAVHEDGLAHLAASDVLDAVEKVTGRRKRGIGFHAEA